MYTIPSTDEDIRQGDIFRLLPKIDMLLGPSNLPQITEPQTEGMRVIDWFQLAETTMEVTANVGALVRPVLGIVISQDCDAGRASRIAFCEIVPFKKVNSKYNEAWGTRRFVEELPEQTRENQKWYYLAEDPTLGFDQKMGVDFQSVFEVPREMLDAYKEKLRVGRLDDEVAWPHFRERVAEFFRRYPYNEWYPFTLDEIRSYEDKKHISVQRYRWQWEDVR